jgi:4-amino-4-deoxy-L-arabinose transferase-like glycosyltransferase
MAHIFSWRRSGMFLLVTLLLVTAFVVRTWHIDTLPAGLWVDEAVNAADATTALSTHQFKLFYPNNYGREGLFINLQALTLFIFGNTIPALKLWSALFGTLAVLGVYLLGKELFGRRAPAFFASFMMAFGYWSINFSRIGFRAIMTPTFLAFSFYFFFKGLHREKHTDFFLAGIFLGLGLHGYIASRLVPVIFVLLLPFLFLGYQNFLQRFWKQLIIFGLGAFLSAAPMFYHFFVSHPEDFISRSAAVSVFSPEVNNGNLLGTLGQSFLLSMQKYNGVGDANWRHNYPPYPLLDPITGVFFLTGFLFLFFQWFTLLWQRLARSIRDPRLVRNSFLLITLVVMSAPEFLTTEGLPHALRSIGTQIPVFLIAGFAVHWLYRYGERSLPLSRTLFHGLVLLLLVSAASINLVKYFVFFQQSPDQKASFTYTQRQITRYINELPQDARLFIATNDRSRIQGNGLPIDVQPLAFYLADEARPITWLTPGADVTLTRNTLLIMTYKDPGVVRAIVQNFPESTVETVDSEPGTKSDFTVIHLR